MTEQNLALARIEVVAPITVVVPTYKEAENIPLLIERVEALRTKNGLDLELVFMDDQSDDGSKETVARADRPWVRLVERSGPRGLSLAVIDGFRIANGQVLVCMDCDLSHPPEKIPLMILGLETGQQMVIGSRYVPGGSTDDDWGFFRWLNSRIATLLALPLTGVKDPMSGFFVMRKSDFDHARDLNPVGYKVALELMVKSGLDNVGEVPIHFTDRVLGESKLTLKEQLRYIQHVRRLYIHKFANAMHFLQFAVVGASGVVVNLAVLSLLLLLGFSDAICLSGGIAVSVVSNFVLNRRFSFSYARDRNPWVQFAGFLGASAVGLAVNYGVAFYLSQRVFVEGAFSLHVSAVFGVACGVLFNFLGNRFVVFRKRHISE